MNQNNIDFYLRIENTKIIFDFLQAIWKEKWRGNIFQSEEECEKDVRDYITGVISGQGIYYHNPISRFVSFWDSYFEEDSILPNKDLNLDEKSIAEKQKKGISVLTTLYQYYFKVKCLFDAKAFDFDKAPYMYEDICVLMCKLMNYNMCYLVSYQEKERPIIIVQSGYYVPYFNKRSENNDRHDEKILDVETIEKYIEYSCKEKSGANYNVPIAGIYCFKKSIEKIGENNNLKENQNSLPQVLLLKLRGRESKEDIERRSFFVLFHGPKNNESVRMNSLLYHVPKILLVREKLSTILYRDCDRLIGMKHNYGYVTSIKRYQGNKDSIVRILHISDLHIDSSSEMEKYLEGINNLQDDDQRVDLLAITGDVVVGQGEARNLQKNYEKAEIILKKIAEKLWAGKPYTDRIPNDWKKRILITTGNHDYACMNELQVNVEGRKTRYIGPSGEKGGTMVKFAYFIEFLQKFLDIPMDQLISNDLNEVRYYKHLNLKIFLLNSTSKANPYQTNKVGINKEIAAQLKKEAEAEREGTLHLCLTHHAENYEISYLNDVYEFYKYKTLKLECLESFKILMENMAEYMPENVVYNALNSLNGKKFKEDFEQEIIKEGYKKREPERYKVEDYIRWKNERESFFKSVLYSDMQKLYNWKNLGNPKIGETDDYIIQIVNRCRDLVFTARNDKKIYEQDINAMGFNFIFSGHEHFSRIEKKAIAKAINITVGTAKDSQYLFTYDKVKHTIEGKLYYKGQRKDETYKIEVDPSKENDGKWKTLQIIHKVT